MTAATDHAPAAVFRRHVFYLHGFDPRGPAVYHSFFRDGAQSAGQRWDRSISVGQRKRTGPHSSLWTIESQDWRSDTSVITAYEVLRWDDVVRRHWFARREARLAYEACAFALRSWRRGILKVSYRPAWAGFLAMVVPPVFLLSTFLVLLILALCVGLATWYAAGAAGAANWLQILLAIASSCAAGLGLFRLWKFLEQRVNILWLTRSLAYLRGSSDGRFDRCEDRAAAFAEKLRAVWERQEVDEILLVGHSLGAMHLVRIGARLMRALPADTAGPAIVMMTLGQSIPLYSMLGGDEAFANDLALLATSDRLRLLDVTSGSDPGSSCRVPLVWTVDLHGQPSRVISREPDFHDVLEPETFRYIRVRPPEFHFQYLKPSERGHGFDYFELVTRPEFIRTSVGVSP